MEKRAVVERVIKNLGFEVEPITKIKTSQDRSKLSLQTDPLNVKIKVRKKEINEPLSPGFISNNQSEPEMVQKVRLVNSDETIMSFDMFVDAEAQKKSSQRSRRHIFDKWKPGLCLGGTDEDDHPYMPESGYSGHISNGSPTSKSDGILRQQFALSKNTNEPLPNLTKSGKTFLGKKCKPGGCLDPPFGEEKYAYKPRIQDPLIPTKSTEVKTPNIDSDIKTGYISPEKKGRKSKDIWIKPEDTRTKETNSILSLYKIESPRNSVITYPPNDDEAKVLQANDDKKHCEGKTIRNRISSDVKSRQSINESVHSFFNPPKGVKRDSNNYAQRDSPKRELKPVTNKPIEYVRKPVPISTSFNSVSSEQSAGLGAVAEMKPIEIKLSEEKQPIASETIFHEPDHLPGSSDKNDEDSSAPLKDQTTQDQISKITDSCINPNLDPLITLNIMDSDSSSINSTLTVPRIDHKQNVQEIPQFDSKEKTQSPEPETELTKQNEMKLNGQDISNNSTVNKTPSYVNISPQTISITPSFTPDNNLQPDNENKVTETSITETDKIININNEPYYGRSQNFSQDIIKSKDISNEPNKVESPNNDAFIDINITKNETHYQSQKKNKKTVDERRSASLFEDQNVKVTTVPEENSLITSTEGENDIPAKLEKKPSVHIIPFHFNLKESPIKTYIEENDDKIHEQEIVNIQQFEDNPKIDQKSEDILENQKSISPCKAEIDGKYYDTNFISTDKPRIETISLLLDKKQKIKHSFSAESKKELNTTVQVPKYSTKINEIQLKEKLSTLVDNTVAHDLNTVHIDLGFHTYLNNKNEVVLKTIDVNGNEPIKRCPNDSITYIKSQIKLSESENSQKINIPIDSKLDMYIKIKKSNEKNRRVHTKSTTKTTPIPGLVPTAKANNLEQRVHYKMNENDKISSTLADVYEQELIPLQILIRNLKEEIDDLVTQQIAFKKKVSYIKKNKVPRLIHSNKRCG